MINKVHWRIVFLQVDNSNNWRKFCKQICSEQGIIEDWFSQVNNAHNSTKNLMQFGCNQQVGCEDLFFITSTVPDATL